MKSPSLDQGLAEQPWPAVDVLETYVAPERLVRVDQVLRHRLGSVTAVFEDVFDPHNVAACVRTCEAYGLQDLHWVLNKHDLRLQSTVAKSSDQWIDLHRHASTQEGVAALKAQGYELWVSDLQATETLADIPLPPKVAIVVGNAKSGISEEMRAAADRRYILPMWGMVQSYNLSVALAITLESLVPRRRDQLRQSGLRGDLPMERMWRLRRRWLEYGMQNAEIVRRNLGDLEVP
jgi:tRNA (guanosine-2'-O-)-methyltransferase